ncbi:Fur-regulated basic protein FbpA [Bacillus salipaludis]|uniref:Fur-regulated basic protein FbpA n=1 Tax=Bacillus salipaludis TaxID=2547811 RepID=A0A4R5VSD1_9BACI|nr:Fur-regulated basic protein FbpA [Bacillus salipaludis]MDQ6598695.1 Fur-regulated basic protein FbpA [Bacillus salipaludis]TDK60761.1 Fur-regulated basic protein FbpA [Bacillus salipaludis]
MGDILRDAVEKKRKQLIEKLIAFNVYKSEDKHLFELSLTELETEYRTFKSQQHPHGNLGSIKFSNKKK